jgi:hypothetical protein
MIESFARPSPRLAMAFEVARLVHEGAVRKGTSTPYIEHPVAVARILENHGYGEDLVVAGLLHDTVEDANYGSDALQRSLSRTVGAHRLPCPSERLAFRAAFLRYLQEEFGSRVFDLVIAVSESKNDGREPKDWLERKKEQLDHLARAPHDAAALKAADALHNIECTLRDVRQYGLGVLDRFRGGSLVAWHYQAIAQLVGEQMAPGDPLASSVRDQADQLCAAVRGLRPSTPGPTRYPPPTVW